MKPIQGGKHRQRVTLQDIPEDTRDSYGQPILESVEIGTYWAEVRPLQGREQLNVRAMWATATHTVTLRWLGSDITILPRMRFSLVKDGRTLNILNANNTEERNRSWVCTCEERAV